MQIHSDKIRNALFLNENFHLCKPNHRKNGNKCSCTNSLCEISKCVVMQ